MCDWGNTIKVNVKIPADLDRTGEVHWRDELIDSCVAKIVAALQKAGIDMRGSCCGHGKSEGEIHLQDGRTLLVLSKEQSDLYWKVLTFNQGEPVTTVMTLLRESDIVKQGHVKILGDQL